MSKKKKNQNKVVEQKRRTTIENSSILLEWKSLSWLGLILLVTFFVYLPVLHNNFISWDDDTYIITNKIVHSFNLREIFSSFVKGNYHPLTILAYAIEYRLFGLHETGYHAVNLFLHLINVILVFYLIVHLSNKIEIALVASLLFGIHPIHVESVAWVAELKDLLYTFFFLASSIFYLKYLADQKTKYYVFALLLFIASLLSKAMAASLPIALMLIDYFKGRKINTKTIIEKLPFFVLSIIFGVVAITAQKTAGATDVVSFSFLQRMAFASYSFFAYLYKLVLPIQLSAYYPYPMEKGAYVTTPYYVYLLLFLILVAGLIFSLRFSKKPFFSFGFFAITIFLVLQLFPVGGALMADRYCYIPSIGIFYLAGESYNSLLHKRGKWIASIPLALFVLFFSVSAYTRCQVWKNDLIFWNDVINQYQTVPPAYFGRGLAMVNENKNEEAIKDFNKAIELKPDFANAFISRAVALVNIKNYEDGLKDLSKAIELQPNNLLAYANRGKLYMGMNRFDEALKDYNRSIELKPEAIEGYYNRGTVLMNSGKNDDALKDFNKTLEMNPRFADAHVNRGIIYYNQKLYDEAIRNFSKAIALKADYANAFYMRGLCEFYTNNKDAACNDLKIAVSMGYQLAVEALGKICN